MSQHRPTRRDALALGLLAPAAALGAAPAPLDESFKAAAEARVKAAREVLALCRDFLLAPPRENGIPSRVEVAEEIQRWSRALAEARLEVAANRDERLAVLTEEVDRARDFAGEIKELARGGADGLTRLSFAKAEYYRADAEARLAREKAGP